MSLVEVHQTTQARLKTYHAVYDHDAKDGRGVVTVDPDVARFTFVRSPACVVAITDLNAQAAWLHIFSNAWTGQHNGMIPWVCGPWLLVVLSDQQRAYNTERERWDSMTCINAVIATPRPPGPVPRWLILPPDGNARLGNGVPDSECMRWPVAPFAPVPEDFLDLFPELLDKKEAST